MEITLFLKNNTIQDSMGKEENGYPVPDSNRTMINVSKNLNETHKKYTQRKNLGRNH
jgi:hypothetical protein